MRRLTDEQRTLAATCFRLALAKSNEAARGWEWVADDIESAAMLAVVKAASAFDPSRRRKFSTLAGRCVRNAIINVKVATARIPRPTQSVSDDAAMAGLADHRRPHGEDAADPLAHRVRCAPVPDRVATPCVACGTDKGGVSPGRRGPGRVKGMCGRCYKASLRARRKQAA